MIRLNLFLLLQFFVFNVSYANALALLDETDTEIHLKRERVIELIDSSGSLRNTSYVKTIEVCQQAIKLAEELKDPNLLSKSYKTQGINYYYSGNTDSSLCYYNKAISQFEILNSKEDIGKILGNIGLLYLHQGKYDRALEYYLENLSIYQELSYKKGLGSVYNNLGNLYQLTEDLVNAEKYYNLALSNFKEFENTQQIANAYCNLGAIYEKRKEYDKSLDYYQKSLAENSKTGHKPLESKIIFNIGYLYHSQGKLDSAFNYVIRSEKIRTEIGDLKGIISSNLELGRISIDMNEYKLAEKYLLTAESIAIENDMLTWRSEILVYLTELFKKQKKFAKAFQYQSQMIQISDSLKIKESDMRFKELITKYEAEKREKELELLQQKDQIQNLELDKKNAWILTLLIVIILGIVAIVVSLRINRLRAEHKIMDLRQKVLLTQMNPHFLFNSLTAIQSFILDERNDEANNYLARLASLVRGILENSREEFVSIGTELKTLEDYISLQKLRFENEISYQFDIDENIDSDLIAVPPMLAQPFVENALIHGKLRNNPQAEIKVKITLVENEKLLKFQIQDNGIGIDEAKKIISEKNHKSLATSIALDRVKIYNFKSAQKMNFEMIDLKHIDPNLHGTQVTYTIPVNYCIN